MISTCEYFSIPSFSCSVYLLALVLLLQGLETPYVVKLHQCHVTHDEKPVFTFVHPNRAAEPIDNTRQNLSNNFATYKSVSQIVTVFVLCSKFGIDTKQYHLISSSLTLFTDSQEPLTVNCTTLWEYRQLLYMYVSLYYAYTFILQTD